MVIALVSIFAFTYFYFNFYWYTKVKAICAANVPIRV